MTALVLLWLAASPVKEVVVYPDRAQVTRSQAVPCAGHGAVTFEGIPPAAEQGSIRAQTDTGVIEGVSSFERTLERAFADKRRTLEDQVLALRDEVQKLQNERTRLQLQDRIAVRYDEVALQLINREAVDKPDSKSWSVALDNALAARLKAAADAVALEAKIRDANERYEDAQRKLNELQSAAGRHEFVAEVRVNCPAGKSASVSLQYLVGGASWTPSYEARADEAGASVELSTYATVLQATGEDWTSTQVTLSTAAPSENATPPELQPLWVYAAEREPPKKVLVTREEVVERADTLTGADNAPAAGGLQAREQGLSVQLRVPEVATVPGDGRPMRLFVGRQKLKATFALKTAPKRQPLVFRTAEAVNSAPFPLLPGMLDAFRRNGFMGRYPIERVAQGALVRLSFGAEEQVRVKRTTLEEVRREVGLFGGKKRFKYSYRIDLANFRKEKVDVQVQEPLPVSELDDVLVGVDEKTTPGYAMKKDDGLATWTVSLKPGDKKSVDVTFHIDIPSSYDTGNM